MTQNAKIMKHLRKAGSITVREAIVEYSIQSLTKRINELRDAGNDIVSVVKFHPMTGQKYVRYYLEENVPASTPIPTIITTRRGVFDDSYCI